MSIASKATKRAGTSIYSPAYRESFLRDTHRLIARGYARLTASAFGATKEEVISEKLAAAINDAIQSPGADSWMHRYHAVDNNPVSHPIKSGNERPRVDIEIIQTRAGKHPLFHFEAKRLGKGYPVGQYVGRKGLGCIIAADYAREHDDAGMLGYVQSGDCTDWAEKISKKLLSNRKIYNLIDRSGWEAKVVAVELRFSYKTQHDRPSLARPVDVYHTLLKFW